MKQILLGVITLIILTIGCKKDDGTEEELNGNYDLEAKVDNQLFTVNKGILSAVITNNAGNGGGYLTIAAYADTAVYFRLNYIDPVTLHKDKIETGEVSNFLLQFSSKGKSYINQYIEYSNGYKVTNPDGVTQRTVYNRRNIGNQCVGHVLLCGLQRG